MMTVNIATIVLFLLFFALLMIIIMDGRKKYGQADSIKRQMQEESAKKQGILMLVMRPDLWYKMTTHTHKR